MVEILLVTLMLCASIFGFILLRTLTNRQLNKILSCLLDDSETGPKIIPLPSVETQPSNRQQLPKM